LIKIKKALLENFCGYRHVEFDFTEGDGVKDLAIFYGPNGCGKSTLLQAIGILASAKRYTGRKVDLVFRKLIFHPNYDMYTDFADYDPVKHEFKPSPHKLKLEGIFQTDDGDKRVIITPDGVQVNELSSEVSDYAIATDADNPMNVQKFQLRSEAARTFLDIAKPVYGFDCFLEKEVEEIDRQTGEIITFYTDFVIYKDYDDAKVHFKSMSAGERKIATLLAMLSDPVYWRSFDIFLVDNIEMHVYFKRHTELIDKIREHLQGRQIIATTHSGEIIRHVSNDCLYDIEEYKRQNALMKKG
jgi:predicted ATPase